MNKLISILFVALGLAGCQPPDDSSRGPGWELLPPNPGAKAIDTKKKSPGIYPVGSRIEDETALGGFGPCENFPKALADNPWGSEG